MSDKGTDKSNVNVMSGLNMGPRYCGGSHYHTLLQYKNTNAKGAPKAALRRKDSGGGWTVESKNSSQNRKHKL